MRVHTGSYTSNPIILINIRFIGGPDPYKPWIGEWKKEKGITVTCEGELLGVAPQRPYYIHSSVRFKCTTMNTQPTVSRIITD